MGAPHLENFLRKLKGCRPSGKEPNQYVACCPAHKDSDPSLAISIGDNGAIVLKCFAGCPVESILAAIGFTDKDMFPADKDGTPRPRLHRPEERKPAYTPEQWEAWNVGYVEAFKGSTVARPLLAKALDLPEAAFDLFPGLGARTDHIDGPCWSFPERDADGRIIGLGLRFKDGKKKAADSSERGLSIPDRWQERPGPLFLPEGPSDTIALSYAGLAAIGRPGVDCKLALLAEFVRNQVPADRHVIWIGENDKNEKTVLASRVACEKLAALAERPVEFALAPPGHKDARAYLTACVDNGDEWPAAGAKFMTAVVAVSVEARPVVELNSNDRYAINNMVIGHIAHDPDLFVRACAIVRVVHQSGRVVRERPVKGGGAVPTATVPPGPRITAASPATLGEYITRRVNFTARRNDKTVSVHPPEWLITAIRDRGQWDGFRPLEAIVDHPVLRPDGTLITEPGYDEQTGVFYYLPEGAERPAVPENPTLEDARRAWETLSELLVDFPFKHPERHRAAWLAAFLTPLARFAFAGPAPLFLVDGNTAGTGKGLLCDTIAIPLTGRSFATTAYCADDDEMRKRITALAVEGDRLVLLDNITGDFGNASIDRALTSTRWKDRILGRSEQMEAPLWATWYGTGNNVGLTGDILRRICHIRLETREERPEEREGFRHADLRAWAAENRARLLGAALTILVAYYRAGAPIKHLRTWGSYEGWSRVVRQAIVWIGLEDPALTREEIQATANLGESQVACVVMNWSKFGCGKEGITAAEIIMKVFPTPGVWRAAPGFEDVADALQGLMNVPSGRLLGNKFRMYRSKRFGDWILAEAGEKHRAIRWTVIKATDGGGESCESGDDFPTPPAQDGGKDSGNTHFRSALSEHSQNSQDSPQTPSGTGFDAFDK